MPKYFDIYMENKSGFIKFPANIKKQTLYLIGWGGGYGGSDQVTDNLLKVSFPWTKGSNFSTGKNTTSTTYLFSDTPGIVLPLRSGRFQTGNFCSSIDETFAYSSFQPIPIEMTDDITGDFSYTVTAIDGEPLFTYLHLYFSYEMI